MFFKILLSFIRDEILIIWQSIVGGDRQGFILKVGDYKIGDFYSLLVEAWESNVDFGKYLFGSKFWSLVFPYNNHHL